MTKQELKDKISNVWQKGKRFVRDHKEGLKFAGHVAGSIGAGYLLAKGYQNRDKISKAVNDKVGEMFLTADYRKKKLGEINNNLTKLYNQQKTLSKTDPKYQELQKQINNLNQSVSPYVNNSDIIKFEKDQARLKAERSK